MKVKGIDGLRALSALCVFGTHAGVSQMKGGALGVDVFFVISGYVITRSLLIEYQQTGRVDILNFYIRRALRLWPALLVMVIPMCLVFATPPADWIPTVFYFSNFTLPDYGRSFTHTWSLSQEEQFYLLWAPLFLLLVTRRPLVWLVVLSIIPAVWGYFLVLSWRESGIPFNYIAYRIDWRITPLFAGCTLAFLNQSSMKRIGFLWPISIALLFWGIVYPSTALIGIAPTFTTIPSFILICKIASDQDGFVTKLLEFKPLAGLGVISYAFYIWHIPIINVFYWPLGKLQCLLLTILIAWFSWIFIERPIRNNRKAIMTSLSRKPGSFLTPNFHYWRKP